VLSIKVRNNRTDLFELLISNDNRSSFTNSEYKSICLKQLFGCCFGTQYLHTIKTGMKSKGVMSEDVAGHCIYHRF